MRSYLIVTILVFVLLLAAHVARIVVEGAGTLSDPLFVAGTLVAAGLAGWGIALLRRAAR